MWNSNRRGFTKVLPNCFHHLPKDNTRWACTTWLWLGVLRTITSCNLNWLSPNYYYYYFFAPGVVSSGRAILSPQGSEAVVSVEADDMPITVLAIVPSSLRVTTPEDNVTVHIFIRRESGASGKTLFEISFVQSRDLANFADWSLVPIAKHLVCTACGAIILTSQIRTESNVQNLTRINYYYQKASVVHQF